MTGSKNPSTISFSASASGHSRLSLPTRFPLFRFLSTITTVVVKQKLHAPILNYNSYSVLMHISPTIHYNAGHSYTHYNTGADEFVA